MRKCCGEPGTLSELRRGGGRGGEADMYLEDELNSFFFCKNNVFF